MNSKNNIVIFGCKLTTLKFYHSIKDDYNISHIITIGSELAKKNNVAGYCDLAYELDKEDQIEIITLRNYSLKNETDVQNILNLDFQLGFSIGWQRLIPEIILKSIPNGVFGMHGSALDLPLGRGRSPLNWAIIEGRKSFTTNLFRYDPGVDSGDIVGKRTFSINTKDTAKSLHYKNLLSMVSLVKENRVSLISGTYHLNTQKNIKPTYYPKRSPDDSIIDWEMPLEDLERLIRAVSKPFNGSFSYINNNKIEILRSSIFQTDIEQHDFKDRKNGEIVEIFPEGDFIVRCFGGLLLILEYKYDGILKINDKFSNGSKLIKLFPRNLHGYFDLPEN